jgi:hypothetical protein
MSFVCRILLQQQLSGKSEDVTILLQLICFGMNLEKIKSLDQKYFEEQKGKFKSSEKT